MAKKRVSKMNAVGKKLGIKMPAMKKVMKTKAMKKLPMMKAAQY